MLFTAYHIPVMFLIRIGMLKEPQFKFHLQDPKHRFINDAFRKLPALYQFYQGTFPFRTGKIKALYIQSRFHRQFNGFFIVLGNMMGMGQSAYRAKIRAHIAPKPKPFL